MKAELLSLAAAAASAAAVGAARIPMDARFIVDGEREVRGWSFNKIEAYKPFGDVSASMLDGVPGVRLSSKGKPVTIYHSVPFKVKPGETCVLRAKVRGNGAGGIGFFAYGQRWAWKGSHGTAVKAGSAAGAEPCPFEARFVVPDDVETVRPTLSASGGGELEFFDVSLEKE